MKVYIFTDDNYFLEQEFAKIAIWAYMNFRSIAVALFTQTN